MVTIAKTAWNAIHNLSARYVVHKTSLTDRESPHNLSGEMEESVTVAVDLDVHTRLYTGRY